MGGGTCRLAPSGPDHADADSGRPTLQVAGPSSALCRPHRRARDRPAQPARPEEDHRRRQAHPQARGGGARHAGPPARQQGGKEAGAASKARGRLGGQRGPARHPQRPGFGKVPRGRGVCSGVHTWQQTPEGLGGCACPCRSSVPPSLGHVPSIPDRRTSTTAATTPPPPTEHSQAQASTPEEFEASLQITLNALRNAAYTQGFQAAKVAAAVAAAGARCP